MDKTPNAFQFKTTSDSGAPTKHYVLYDENISIYTLALVDGGKVANLKKQGFYELRTFKEKTLLVKPVHFKTSTFFTIAQGIVKLEQLKDKAE